MKSEILKCDYATELTHYGVVSSTVTSILILVYCFCDYRVVSTMLILHFPVLKIFCCPLLTSEKYFKNYLEMSP